MPPAPSATPRKSPSPPASPPRRARRGRLFWWAILLLFGGVVAGELAARFVVGLGDPPLYRLDPQTEYELVPAASYRRFGNRYVVNRWGMRSTDDFPPAKAQARELRVMVIGDSIVNAGPRVDQPDIATERLKVMLEAKLARPVVVGNISAGSWGPVNQNAWITRSGLFEADVVLLVTNSGDDVDVPGLEGLGSQWPTRRPLLALQELIGTYGRRALARAMGTSAEPAPLHTPDSAADAAASRKAFESIIAAARAQGARVGVIQHLSQKELAAGPDPGHKVIAGWANDLSVPVWTMDGMAIGRPASEVFIPGDAVHYNANGQAALANVMMSAVQSLTESRP